MVAWDVLPGVSGTVPASDAKNWPHPSTLVLKSITPNAFGPLCRCPLEMRHYVWAFGLTVSNEIRSVVGVPETRWEIPESGTADDELLNTKIDLEIGVPTDPEITKVAIYEPLFAAGTWSLHLLGNVSISQRAN